MSEKKILVISLVFFVLYLIARFFDVGLLMWISCIGMVTINITFLISRKKKDRDGSADSK